MMNIPGGAVTHRGRAIMDAGEDIERRVIERFHRSGILLSSPDPDNQTVLVHPKYWLTGSVDAVILVDGKPHVVEIKTKALSKIIGMKKGTDSYDEQHYWQCFGYTWLVREAQERGMLWKDMPYCDSGTILYLARDDPSQMY
jgi:hypothetical protein